MLWFYIIIFIICCILLYFSGEWVVGSLMRMARFLGWREFVVAFFIMAFAASLPNLFVGITSALHQIPELSFGDIAGNNLVALTIAVALAVLISKKALLAESKTVQTTSIFTIMAAILPILLILFDNELSRSDGLILIFLFISYLFWLFSKEERFTKIYDTHKISILKDFKGFLIDLGKLILGIGILIGTSQGIVISAKFFAQTFIVPITLIGLLITGFGSALPEVYFAIASAKRGETWMILGDLMGAVIIPATLVLGIVALIHPIKISSIPSLVVARIFLIVAALSFLFCVKSGKKITKREAFFLLGIYILFLIVEILIK